MEYFALCSEHFEVLCFSRSVLIGTPMDFKRFYLEKCLVPPIYMKPKDSLDIDCPRNEGRLENRFFPEKRSLDVSLGPYRETSVTKIPPPQTKENRILSDWEGLFEICFRSSEMTDPRPCPRGWAYFRVPSRSTKTCYLSLNQQQIIGCKDRYFLGVRETSQDKTPPPQRSIGRFSGKNLFVLSLPQIILKQARLMVQNNTSLALITFCQVRSKFSAEGLTLTCILPALAIKDDWKAASS